MLAAFIVSCAGHHDDAPADLDVADLSGAIHEVGPFGCAAPLERYCAQNGCVADLTTATAAARERCSDPSRPTIAYTVTCRDDVVVTMTATDAGSEWVYDRPTGRLVAVLWHANVEAGCSGGPTELDLLGCGGEDWLCPP